MIDLNASVVRGRGRRRRSALNKSVLSWRDLKTRDGRRRRPDKEPNSSLKRGSRRKNRGEKQKRTPKRKEFGSRRHHQVRELLCKTF